MMKKGRRDRAKPQLNPRPVDHACQDAFRRFRRKHNLNPAQVARILSVHNGQLTYVANGFRPYAVCLARLYILTGDEAFAASTDKELEAYDKESKDPPSTLTDFKETGKFPPPPNRKDQNKRARELRAKKNKKGQQDQPASQPKTAPPPAQTQVGKMTTLITSPFFDRILSGAAEVEGQFRGGLRFVLTRDHFCQFDGHVTEAEVIDTLILIQELRRRFGIFAQLTDRKERARIARLLHQEINELYVTIEASRTSLPTQAGALLDDLRQQLKAFNVPSVMGEKSRG